MKLVNKFFLAIISIICLTFSLGGFVLIQALHTEMIEQAINLAKQENRLIRFSLIGSAQILSTEQNIDNQFYANAIQAVNQNSNLAVILLNEKQEIIFFNNWPNKNNLIVPNNLQIGQASYQIVTQENKQSLIYSSQFIFNNQTTTLITKHDLTNIFENRHQQLELLKTTIIILVAVDAVIIFLITAFLTRHIKKLSQVTAQFAQGNLTVRMKKISHDEVGELATVFNQMACQLEKKVDNLESNLQKQKEFARSFTHEIKTPLTAIIGYADLLRSKKNNPQRTFMAANYIYEEGTRLEKLSLKLLKLIVLEEKGIVKQEIEISALIKKQVAFMSTELQNNHINFMLNLESALIHGDRDLLKTVLINLIDNAKKSMPNGGALTINGHQKSHHYILEITDSGTGIPSAQLEKIYRAFYKVDQSRKNDGGFGLGLAIVENILTLHQAKITISSAINHGTTVRIIFPTIKETHHDQQK